MNYLRTDSVVLGGGIFGMYAAHRLLEHGRSVTLIESDPTLFSRASSINQARVHLGYHYPRSLGTALYSAELFQRFVDNFKDAIHSRFQKIYAISRRNSFTSPTQFENFCKLLKLPLEPVNEEAYFRKGAVEACFRTGEVVFDAARILEILSAKISSHPGFNLMLSDRIVSVEKDATHYYLNSEGGGRLKTPLVVNATYAGLNSVLGLFGFPSVPVKYELTELALGDVSPSYEKCGVTVMDGPFFSLVPYGLTGLHSLTAVEYTPHATSREALPTFSCQSKENGCSPARLRNCDSCPSKPQSSCFAMIQLAKKYLRDDFYFSHNKSYYAIKTILQTSELDDSRPTYLMESSRSPRFISVLSGKINTIYEMEALLP